MANVLVAGGAGYVGGTTAAWLVDQGHRVWILDSLATGHRDRLVGHGFTHAEIGDRAVVSELLKRERFDCVMHFAARSLVGESVQKPQEYYDNNVVQGGIFLDTLLEHGVRRLIFSSTCAIFGDPGERPIDESLPMNPLSPYGENKLDLERMMARLARERGLNAIALRYFNACGAEPQLRVGEAHDPETHLIPRVLQSALDGVEVQLFGTDYATPDGTCVRDYVHVWDLAEAHGSAMRRLLERPEGAGHFEAFNLGSENGFSVREVIRACEEVTGLKIRVKEVARRPGDPARLVARSVLAKAELGFSPRANSLRDIVASAYAWERKRRTPRRAVFLDRDGTINFDPGYLSKPAQMELLPRVGEALRKLRDLGFVFVVVSNQSGVGRGIIQESAIPRIHDRLDALLASDGVRFGDYELCFKTPEDPTARRKPRPDLLLDAARRMRIDVKNSYMIGDKDIDVQAGQNAGCRASLLVRTGHGAAAERKGGFTPDFIADSLLEAADWIADRETAGS